MLLWRRLPLAAPSSGGLFLCPLDAIARAPGTRWMRPDAGDRKILRLLSETIPGRSVGLALAGYRCQRMLSASDRDSGSAADPSKPSSLEGSDGIHTGRVRGQG